MNEKPNVILMLVDDLGYGDISGLNPDSRIKTPHIDALMDRGLCFTDAHSTSALCTPSRYGLLTGRYNWRSRLKESVLMGDGAPLIEQGRLTMAQMFKADGYYTACIGKWHLGMGWTKKQDFDGAEYGAKAEIAQMKAEQMECGYGWNNRHLLDTADVDFDIPCTDGPVKQGFDYFFGLNASIDQPPFTYIENDRVVKKPDHLSGVWPLDRAGATQQQEWQRGPAAAGHDFTRVVPDMQNKVLKQLDQHAGQPFFIYYPTPAVHGPLLPTSEFAGKSGLNVYADMVLMVDQMVGEITAKLKEKGIWEETIFIFTSDNGCSGVADYPYLLAHGHNPSYIFRGKKGDIWEGGHRVPTILSWPEKYSENTQCTSMICLADFFRTFAEMLDYELPANAGEDSFSLQPVLDNPAAAVRQSIIHSAGDGSFSIREKDWKLELCHAGGGMGPQPLAEGMHPCQLYDLNQDVGERKNLAPQMPEKVRAMTRDLIEAINQGRTTPGSPQKNTPPEHEPWQQYEQVLGFL